MKNSGIHKTNTGGSTNVKCDISQTAINKGPGKEKILHESDEPDRKILYEPDEPDGKKLKSAKELALRAKREEW